MLTYDDFPDPNEYLIGFFCCREKEGCLESSISDNASGYSSKYKITSSEPMMVDSLKARVNPQYLSITITDSKKGNNLKIEK